MATYYATVCQECPAGCGMLVRTREGRAVKVEGNPAHPLNRGGLCARGHASLQGLYNPDRFRGPFRRRTDGGLAPLSWPEAESLFAERVRQVRDNRAADRLAFLAGRLPDSLYDLAARWLAALGSERLLTYEPFGDEALRQAGRVCFDRADGPRLRPCRGAFSHRLRRRLSGHVAFAYALCRGVRPHAAHRGPTGRRLRPGRIAHVAHRRQRGRVDCGRTRPGSLSGARHGAPPAARQRGA